MRRILLCFLLVSLGLASSLIVRVNGAGIAFVSTAKSSYSLNGCNPCSASVTVSSSAGAVVVVDVLMQNCNGANYGITDTLNTVFSKTVPCNSGIAVFSSIATGVASSSGSDTVTVTQGAAIIASNGIMVTSYSGVKAILALSSCTSLSYPSGVGSFTLSCPTTVQTSNAWLVGESWLGCTNVETFTAGTGLTERQNDPSPSNGVIGGDMEDPNGPLASGAFTYSTTISNCGNGGGQTNGLINLVELDPLPAAATASGNVDNAVVTGSSMLVVLSIVGEVALLFVIMSLTLTLFSGGRIALGPILTLGIQLVIIVTIAVSVLAVIGTFDPIFRAQGN